MMAILPITLTGNNLGERHHQLNNFVNVVYFKKIPFTTVKNLPEKSPLDRLFKIDLASKYKNMDYIVVNLKHKDMLYVSRALKCTWLLNKKYSKIINPVHLENVLYPEMTSTAVKKMKHWIELNLKEPDRNHEFYQFYVKINFDAAIKFIWKCSKEVIMSEATKGLLEHVDPHHLKILIEKCPDIAKVYFGNLENNRSMLEKYLKKEQKYFNALKPLLKVNGDDFLDITEKYFNGFKRFSPEATKYILRNYKARFNKKPELYTSSLLDVTTLAQHLTEGEIKDLILKLARARYIHHWFSYKNVEPLIKKLSIEERTSLKKIVFVAKDVGDMIETWQYVPPSSPTLKSTESNIFEDKEHDPREYEVVEDCDLLFDLKRIKKKSKSRKWDNEMVDCISVKQFKSPLDQLFDKYRFVGFEKTFFDLRKQLKVETLQQRQNIMLVLISKSGGRIESLEQLLNFLVTCHENEPEHLRATVIRSSVRRCCVWRVPQNVWELLLKFGRGVGLDGVSSTVACTEGLHAVIIRNIILDQEIDPVVWKAFLKEFSTLTEYTLNASEKKKISSTLPELLIAAAKNETEHAVDLLGKALDSLDAFKMRIDECQNLVTIISKTAHNNADAAPLLHRLFDSRIARKELFRENFIVIQNNASYYNALKHDTSVLATGETFEALVTSNKLAHDKFITTLSLYLNEENGIGTKYLALLKKHIKDEKLKKHKLARYIAILSGESIVEIMQEFNDAEKKSEYRRIAAALRANCHLARPLVNLNAIDMKLLGAKAVSNRVLRCSTKDVPENLKTLIAWERTQKLAFVLSTRVGKEANVLQIIGEKRPRVALKKMLQHSKIKKLDDSVWTTVLPLIKKLNKPNNINDRLRKALTKTKQVPANIKKDYYIAVFEVFRKITNGEHVELPVLCQIENILFEIDPAFIESVIRRFLIEEFTPKKLTEYDYYYGLRACLHIRITVKYLLLCKSNTELQTKWENIGELFFDRFDEIWNAMDVQIQTMPRSYLDELLLSLKYTKVFLDSGYVSCLPMYERIVKRLHSTLPIHRYFDVYISLHLIMLYFKSVRQSVKNNAIVFEDLPKNVNQAAEIVGRIFGKLVAREVIDLIDKYFASVIEIYKEILKDFLESHFESNQSWSIMVTNIARSFLKHDNSKVQLLAVHMYKTIMRYNWPEEERDEIFEKLNASKDMEILLSL